MSYTPTLVVRLGWRDRSSGPSGDFPRGVAESDLVMQRNGTGWWIALIVVAGALLAACSPQGADEQQAAGQGPAVPEEAGTESPAADEPREDPRADVSATGLVTSLVGQASVRESGADCSLLQIGDDISTGVAVRVDSDSYVDIQLGTLGTVRLDGNTTVAGVRGTDFNVTAEPSGHTLVGVSSGSVAPHVRGPR